MKLCGSPVRRAALLSLGLLFPCTSALPAQEFQVDVGSERLVRFISQAPIEDFDGVTERIDGYVVLDGPSLAGSRGGEGTSFYFEVELASLDTGIGLRNRHMRDNYLEVEDYPYATFEGRVVSVRPDGEGAFQIDAEGQFSAHGVARSLNVPCRGIPDPGGFRVACAFQVLLSDHDIKIPKVMFMKLADEIRLELDFGLIPPQ